MSEGTQTGRSGNARSTADEARSMDRAFDTAVEINKQILAISTGILALSATFLQDPAKLTGFERQALGTSWTLFALAAFFGLLMFMFSAGKLTTSGTEIVKSWQVRLAAALQIVSFLGAVIALIVFALSRL